MTDVVLREQVTDAVQRIVLNRPERLNAMDFPLVGALHDALDEVASDATCKVVILTGAGRAFCSGLDLADFGTPPAPGTHRRARVGVGGQEFIADLTTHLRETPQIVVAAVNGPAYGGGLALALASDLRICSRSARFCSAFIRTGLTGTDIGVSYLLPRLLGAAVAFDLMVTGRVVDADEAERLRLVSRVTDDDALAGDATALAESVAEHTAAGLRMTKEVMWANLDAPNMAAAIALENRNQQLAGTLPEVLEHMAAYSSRHRS